MTTKQLNKINSSKKPSNGLETKEYIIDATNKRIGHVATEAASVLLGKNTSHFAKNVTEAVIVKIINAAKLDISEKRATEEFQHYSGYPGGRKVETLGHLAKRRGFGEVMWRVVAGMLPKNKLHAKRMHNLVVTE
jgi:large subunit ribosomal protein L13